MRFSGKSHSNLYLMFILAIAFYISGDFPSFYELDQDSVNINLAFGQVDDGQNEGKENIPITIINTAIDGNNNVIVNNGSTTSNSMRFTFSGMDDMGKTINRFECSIDGKPFVTCISTNTVNVVDGTHTFSVRSEDNAGNKDSTPASYTWTVDTTPPTTSITSAVDGNNSTLSNNGKSNSTSIKFSFDGNDTGGVGIHNHQCNIDNSQYVACTSPFIFPNLLKDGSHTFTVFSEDNAGNKDSSPAS
jgi:hypothetical protein